MSAYPDTASLTRALLANKGAAAPTGSVLALPGKSKGRSSAAEQPCGDEPDSTGGSVSTYVSAGPGRSVIPVDDGPRAKLSVRLDQDRHLRLKLAAAHLRRSSQTIMLEALDAYLAQVAPAIGGECACLNEDD